MSSSIGIGFLVIILVLAIGLVGLFVALLANRRTRLFGAVSLAVCVFAGVAVFAWALTMSGMRAQHRVQAEFRAMNDLRRAVERAQLSRQLEELNQPRIDLEANGHGGSAAVAAAPKSGVEVRTDADGKIRVINHDTGETAEFDINTPMSDVADSIGHTDADASASAKPDWVINPPKRVGETVRIAFDAGPYTTLDECNRFVDHALLNLASSYAEGQTPQINPPTPTYTSMSFRLADLRRRLVRDEYVEAVDTSVGEMKRLHTLVEISPSDGRWLVEQRQLAEQSERLGQVGFFAAVVLGLLGAAFGLLKTDELTRGYYSKRLFIGVPAVLLTLLTIVLLVAR